MSLSAKHPTPFYLFGNFIFAPSFTLITIVFIFPYFFCKSTFQFTHCHFQFLVTSRPMFLFLVHLHTKYNFHVNLYYNFFTTPKSSTSHYQSIFLFLFFSGMRQLLFHVHTFTLTFSIQFTLITLHLSSPLAHSRSISQLQLAIIMFAIIFSTAILIIPFAFIYSPSVHLFHICLSADIYFIFLAWPSSAHPSERNTQGPQNTCSVSPFHYFTFSFFHLSFLIFTILMFSFKVKLLTSIIFQFFYFQSLRLCFLSFFNTKSFLLDYFRFSFFHYFFFFLLPPSFEFPCLIYELLCIAFRKQRLTIFFWILPFGKTTIARPKAKKTITFQKTK